MKRALLFLTVLVALVYWRNFVVTSPAWDPVALPFRILRLSTMPPDEVLWMPLPQIPVRRVANTWGAPRSGGRQHEGQDLFAPKGTPVYSATRGVVVRITDRTLGGNSVFVLGPGGRTYFYTHLDAYAGGLQAGHEVTPGTVLGYVGNTGNARTTPPHLHFGVYTHGGAVNPLPLLRDRPLAAS